MLGIPHPVAQDDMYMGYRIPKGSTVIVNVWAVHNDPKRHLIPWRFEPMRYIYDQQTSIDAANNPDVTKRDHFVFGGGRRKCQGMHIADRSIFLAISRLLWAFEFNRATDPETGEEIIPDMNDISEGMMALPNPFPLNIQPRSPGKAAVIQEKWAEVSKLLNEEQQWEVAPEGLIWKDEQVFE
ncbi:cytochrome P450 [Xylaria grammica]|nr:cytochrome P450 [Xylaria grammica]